MLKARRGRSRGFRRSPKATQAAINTAATLGTVSGLSTAANQTWSREKWDEQQEAYYQDQYEKYKLVASWNGDDYSERGYLNLMGVNSFEELYVPYSAWRAVGNTAIATVTSAAPGALAVWRPELSAAK